MDRAYTIPYRHFAICSGGTTPALFLDLQGNFDENALRDYFGKGYKLFMLRLRRLKTLKRRLTPKEERELKFMCEALIDAKNFLHEK